MAKELDLTVVIPVYRAESCLAELHQRLIASLETTVDTFEIIFVEDSGGDGSWNVIEQLATKDNRVRGIKLSRNFGQQAATMCGMAQAKGHWVATIDDDLEQPPEDIAQLLEKAKEGFSLVYGIFPKRSHSWWRNVTSNVVRRLFKLAIPQLNFSYSSFRLIQGDIARALCQFESPFPFIDGYLSWLTSNYATVISEHSSRQHGKSNYTFKKLLGLTVNCFVTFSDLPLRIASWLGILSFLVGMIWVSVIISMKFLGEIQVSGFASLMAGIILFGGIQLLILGIFGEYLARINFKTSKKPLYLIGRRTVASQRLD